MDRTSAPSVSFEQYSAERLKRDREQIARDWVERLSTQLDLTPEQVLPEPDLLNDIPTVLERAADFLLVPAPERLTTEQRIREDMRNIALLRHQQGWPLQEIVREFDELAQLLDGAALQWIDDYPGVLDPKSIGRVFGRLNRVPLLMGQIMVGALEGERATLLRQLSAAEEEERARLSRELHDQLGQGLTALILGLNSLERSQGDGDQSGRIRELVQLTEQITREAQQLALDLRPPALDRLGLRFALAGLAGEWSARTGIDCDFFSVLPERERFTPEVETALYRIAQEGLNNVLKHAGATRTSLVLERADRLLTLILEDDGSGFDVEQTLARPDKANRLGLRGIGERVARLGGSVEIESSPGSGTTLFVRVPLHPVEESVR